MATIEIAEEQTYEAIKALAEQMHKSIEEVVAIAVVEKMTRDRARDRVQSGLGKRLADIGREAARMFPESERTGDITAKLYDERGLPH